MRDTEPYVLPCAALSLQFKTLGGSRVNEDMPLLVYRTGNITSNAAQS